MAETDTGQLSGLVDRLRAGDATARDELLRSAMGRLELLTRKMLRGYPGVRRWEDTADVLQNSLVRLVRSLADVKPGSSREFFGLAAAQIRRELLDLARHYQGPHGTGKNHQSGVRPGEAGAAGIDPVDAGPQPGELDRWTALHTAVEVLPVEEREVFMLAFYHGWTQIQIAELFGLDERTIRRRWQKAAVLLQEAIGELPGG